MATEVFKTTFLPGDESSTIPAEDKWQRSANDDSLINISDLSERLVLYNWSESLPGALEKPTRFYDVLKLSNAVLRRFYPDAYTFKPEQIGWLNEDGHQRLYDNLKEQAGSSETFPEYDNFLYFADAEMPPALFINVDRLGDLDSRAVITRASAESNLSNVIIHYSILNSRLQKPGALSDEARRLFERMLEDNANRQLENQIDTPEEVNRELLHDKTILRKHKSPQVNLDGATVTFEADTGFDGGLKIVVGDEINNLMVQYIKKPVLDEMHNQLSRLYLGEKDLQKEVKRFYAQPMNETAHLREGARQFLEAIGIKSYQDAYRHFRNSNVFNMYQRAKEKNNALFYPMNETELMEGNFSIKKKR